MNKQIAIYGRFEENSTEGISERGNNDEHQFDHLDSQLSLGDDDVDIPCVGRQDNSGTDLFFEPNLSTDVCRQQKTKICIIEIQ